MQDHKIYIDLEPFLLLNCIGVVRSHIGLFIGTLKSLYSLCIVYGVKRQWRLTVITLIIQMCILDILTSRGSLHSTSIPSGQSLKK